MVRLSAAGLLALLALGLPQLNASSLPSDVRQPQLTPAPAGPFRVVEGRLADAQGRPFPLRGTALPEFRLETVAFHARSGDDFGAYSGTALSAIRLRFNMNAVRLPVNVAEATGAAYFSELAQLVKRANGFELVVILAAQEPGAALPSRRTVEFWSHCAAALKDNPNVIFAVFADPQPSAVPPGIDPHSAAGWDFWKRGGPAADGREVAGMNDLVRAIRSAGARQPVAAMSWNDARLFEGAGVAPLLDDANVVYEVSPRFATTRTDAQRDAQFGYLAAHAPVVAHWDMDLDHAGAECSAVPQDPTAATALVEQSLDYFDARQISWTVSEFAPGRLVRDLVMHDATSLENGWTCGKRLSMPAGIGRLVQAHLRAAEERELFVVSFAGGIDVSRAGYAVAYGPVMAERDSESHGPRLPFSLGGVSIQVTDAKGVTRPVGINWASAGWGQVNFVIPAESAVGPARMTLARADGSTANANLTIADTAPGFRTGISCRGAALGSVTQVFADGRTVHGPLSECRSKICAALPIPLASGATTRVRLIGSGFRYAGAAAKIEVTVGGNRLPVVSFGSAGDPGMDQLTVEIPAALGGLGEADLICRINGRIANAVRIRIGGEKPVS
jgi:uncharacterized protein (TIGR03437 family)